MTEISVSVETGRIVATCPHCGEPLSIRLETGELVRDVANAATTAMGVVTARNIIRNLVLSGQVPPEVLEDVKRCELSLTETAATLSGGF